MNVMIFNDFCFLDSTEDGEFIEILLIPVNELLHRLQGKSPFLWRALIMALPLWSDDINHTKWYLCHGNIGVLIVLNEDMNQILCFNYGNLVVNRFYV